MPSIQVELVGLDKTLDRLRNFSSEVAKKSARNALRKAANVIKDQAVANALALNDPTTTESVFKNIRVQFASRSTRRTGDPMMRVGVLGGAKKSEQTAATNPGGDTWYWRLLEFGTENMEARPLMRKAVDQRMMSVFDVFAYELDTQVKKLDKK
jgi:HK97 gp10 family phage protein